MVLLYGPWVREFDFELKTNKKWNRIKNRHEGNEKEREVPVCKKPSKHLKNWTTSIYFSVNSFPFDNDNILVHKLKVE